MKRAIYLAIMALLVSAPMVLADDPPSGVSAAGDKTTLLFDRGLPIINLNNDAGAFRSNISWADAEASSTPTEYWLPGDDFTISKPGKHGIRTIRVWIVGDVPDGIGDEQGDEQRGKDAEGQDQGEHRGHGRTHLTLWGGIFGSAIAPISKTYSVTPVTYVNGEIYQGWSGAWSQINQVDFAVDFELKGGQTFQFFVDGPWQLLDPTKPFDSATNPYANPFLHASNSGLSGSRQDGSDDFFLWLHRNNGNNVAVDTWNSGTGAGTLCAPTSLLCPGWDKPSDGNVQVFGRVQKGQDKH